MSQFRIFTDGACLNNPGVGGWAFVILDEKGAIFAEERGAAFETTNNRMELMAVLQALRKVPADAPVFVTSDSKYVINGATDWLVNWIKRGWKTAAGKDVANKDLWREMQLEITKRARVRIQWHWVKGHAGHEWNERCDRQATEIARMYDDAEMRA